MAKKPTKNSGPNKSDANDEVIIAPDSNVDETPEITSQDNVPEAETTPDTVVTKSEPVEEPQAPPPVVEKDPVPAQPPEKGVFLPLLIGGIIAGALGYGAAYITRPDTNQGLEQIVATHTQTIADLQETLTSVEGNTDTTAQLDALQSTLNARSDDLEARIASGLADLDERLSAVEKQPNADGTLQDTAIAAFQRDIDDLRAQIDAQQSEMQQMADDAMAQLEVARTEAAEIEAGAENAARAATARAALARIQGALESGAAFGPALSDLAGAIDDPVPPALSDVADGVPTLAQLQTSFPPAARAALATARSEGASGEESGTVTSFLRSQFDVRSVAPREGNSADAVLSRAEAALREGRLNDTLAEVSTLPEVARGALTDWVAMAEARADAITAADSLSLSLNDN